MLHLRGLEKDHRVIEVISISMGLAVRPVDANIPWWNHGIASLDIICREIQQVCLNLAGMYVRPGF